jgi:Uma2 family endonuclease
MTGAAASQAIAQNTPVQLPPVESARGLPVPTPALKRAPKPITWVAFQKKYLDREDGYKYEWVNGLVEKTKRSMDKTQLYILRTLQAYFRQLLNAEKAHGELVSEPDLFFMENHRRPDIAWLTDAQIDRLAYDSRDVPAFIIEVISSNDQINKVQKKMLNYRESGVQVVWHVFPTLGLVHVYSGENLDAMQVRSGDQLCSAAPVLPDFAISVSDILKKPIAPPAG